MIRLEDVSASIGRIQILSDINLHVGRGQLVAVVGANGAGKTTLLRAISRLLPASRGSITFNGRRINDVEAHRLAREGLVHVPQGRQIIPTLTVEDNLLIGARRVPGLSTAEIQGLLLAEYERFPVLRERADVLGGSLSGGEQQMLAVSRALMMRPKVLMLDEPSLGLAPQIVGRIMEALAQLRRQGMTIILVEQIAQAALRVADFGYVLRQGRIALSGPAGDLRGNTSIAEKYLA